MRIYSSIFSAICTSTFLLFGSIFTQTLKAEVSSVDFFNAEKNTSNLITNNPFEPNSNTTNNSTKELVRPGATKNASEGSLGKYLQFKSIVIIDGKKYFSVYNKRRNKSLWLPEGEKIESFQVQNYNALENSITLSDGIISETLRIQSPDGKPMSVASAISKASVPGKTNITAGKTNVNKKAIRPPLPRRRVVPAKSK